MTHKRFSLYTIILYLFFIMLVPQELSAQNPVKPIVFTLSMDHPQQQHFQVELTWSAPENETVLMMPSWTPGYYQHLHYANHVKDFEAIDENGNTISWERSGDSGWRINTTAGKIFSIRYSVEAKRKFVAANFLDSTHGYISPAGVFLYPRGYLHLPAEIIIRNPSSFPHIATGLKNKSREKNIYYAENFDILYDSPILTGNLQEADPFYINGIPHRFITYKAGNFDKELLMADLKKIVQSSIDIIGHIPYDEYTFIGIGPGAGGIEHLNSTTISFTGSSLTNHSSKIRIYNFLAHEYFHHYNAKRIRPIELGPFDYQNGSRTDLLWIAEGLTVYYEYLILLRAGITKEQEFFESLQSNINAFENKPGKKFQSLTQASRETWTDGPFGGAGKDPNRSISYYDKGPVVGMLLDLAIRHSTKNTSSLDDVMRHLYNEFYIQHKRGFTEDEFWTACERIAETSLAELKAYTHTTEPLDYTRYLGYAGLGLDTQAIRMKGVSTGLYLNQQENKLMVSVVEPGSPAAKAGIHPGAELIAVNGSSVTLNEFNKLMEELPDSSSIHLVMNQNNAEKELEIIAVPKIRYNYLIKRREDISKEQKQILDDLSRQKKRLVNISNKKL